MVPIDLLNAGLPQMSCCIVKKKRKKKKLRLKLPYNLATPLLSIYPEKTIIGKKKKKKDTCTLIFIATLFAIPWM